MNNLVDRLRERFAREHLVRDVSKPRSWEGGPYLHWVPNGREGWRLAGDFVPPTGAADGRHDRP